jgi:hypothetical protein
MVMTEQHAVDHIACFLTACEVERREHRSARREQRVVNGRLLSAEAGRFFYSFDASPTISLRDDTSVQLIVGGMFYHGTVYSRASFPHLADVHQASRGDHHTLTIAIQADLGQVIPEARVEGLEHDVLQSLIMRLRALRAGASETPGWNRELAHKVLDLSRNDAKGGSLTEARKLPEDLTPDQVTALSRCLSQQVTYLWGPPGTGKTVALAALALKLFQENKRVLIVSHTNLAVDGVIESLCKRITERGRAAIPEGSILRVGTMVKEALITRYGEQIHLESVINRNQDKVASRLDHLRRELSQVRDALFAASKRITLFDSREQLLKELERARLNATEADASFISAVRQIFKADASSEAGTQTSPMDAGSADTVALIQSSIEQVSKELEGCDRHALADQTVELSNRQLEITEAIPVLEKYVRDLRVSLLDRARIIATTATQAMLSAHDLYMFDAVLIDEASMLPLPLCFLLSGLARERVVVAGDFRQLPAIARSDVHIVRQWYSRDVFECAGVVDLVDAHREHPALVTLTTQFRSNQTLCSLINDRFYGGMLRTDPARLESRVFFKDPLAYLNRSPVVLVDTSRLKPWGEARDGSRSNILHALIVRKIALLLSAHGAGFGPQAIGVICPYRNQANLIRDLLEECSLEDSVSTGTVHKYQGSERDSIILDCTESQPLDLGSFFRAKSLRDPGARLLNVALSRARRYLFVVANLDHLRVQTRGRYLVSDVLDDLQRIGVCLPAEELIGEQVFSTPSKESQEQSGVLAFQAFDNELFMPGLVTDLLAANHEVVFSSPTLTEQVARVVSSIVAQRIQSGLRVTLRVDGGREHSPPEARIIRELRSIGVMVVRAPGTVPPAVVVDSEAVWLGSIAPLDALFPQNGLMVRCVSPRAAYHTLELLETPTGAMLKEDKGQLLAAG